MPLPDPEHLPAMERVQSTTIYEIGYDERSFTLFVRFNADTRAGVQQPGALYRYTKVSPTKWKRFRSASSKGSHFAVHLRDKHGYAKWTGRAWRQDTALQHDARRAREQGG